LLDHRKTKRISEKLQLSSDMSQLQVPIIKLGYIKLGRYAVKMRKKEKTNNN